MLNVEYQSRFKKDYKLALKRGLEPKKFEKVLVYLINKKPLPKKYRDHQLTNSKRYKNLRECHIEPDWLLIYQVIEESLILRLIRTGSHSDLFN